LDKIEIGEIIVTDILIFVLETLYKYKEGFSFSQEVSFKSQHHNILTHHKIIANVNTLLEELQPRILFQFINDFMLESAKEAKKSEDVKVRI